MVTRLEKDGVSGGGGRLLLSLCAYSNCSRGLQLHALGSLVRLESAHRTEETDSPVMNAVGLP